MKNPDGPEAADRIAELEADVAKLTREKDSATDQIGVIWEHHGIWMNRATAAEARADRLEKALQLLPKNIPDDLSDDFIITVAISIGSLRDIRAALDDASETKKPAGR